MILQNISLQREDRLVFSGLNLCLKAHRTGLVGLNGSGKTSLLRLLQGLDQPEQGSILERRNTGLIFQSPDQQLLFPTVMEELCFGQLQRGRIQAELEEKAKALALTYGAQHLVRRPTHELSLGEKQLVCILSVLMDEPETLLFDEPFASLDARTTQHLLGLIKTLPHQIIMASHNLTLLEDFEEVIWLDAGRVVMQGPAFDVLRAFREFLTQPVKPESPDHA
jgi:biotin transport system ATP-binding protein